MGLWRLDQRINERGIRVDLGLARAAVAATEREQVRLAEKAHDMTDGEVASTTQRDALLRHIADTYGVQLPDLRKATVERLLSNSTLPQEVIDLLTIRLQASATSTAKYQALLHGVSSDGRLRGLLQFCGALRTGRWSGRLFQPQNLPRPTYKQNEIDLGIQAIKAGIDDLIFDNPMELISNLVRSCLIPSEGSQFVVADLSNIEGRVAAWISGEEWKLEAFRLFDADLGPDLYCVAYGKSFGIDPAEVTGDQRQVGKVQELALQYGGGANAFATFAAAYSIDLDELADQAWEVIPKETREKSASLLDWMKSKKAKISMSERAWIVCDSFKSLWRTAHPGITGYWDTLDKAVRKAIEKPGIAFTAGRCKVRRDGKWLRIRLPSGRFLCYPDIRIDSEDQITYKGIDQFTRKWTDIHSYGPKFLENLVQSISRDVLAHGMVLAENAGFQIVLTVHDEIISEHPSFDHHYLAELMATNPCWAEGLPLKAAGFTANRYRKG
jgi:DNA polymerase